eukprot:gnl/TRDRNA2_/TRDRNA2_180143_c0_seq1.p1 gnl/TRDRNA2_/TRDRNA2_180143_c0~~gnl/TRDRNA2_/TRDRNA2_180143_c0_seq1.p1  ORF type:complete len:159 (+),score=34.88 gnl/TRDRNA2_/TRDRNA2_180143_c0_seq1:111-587(+)
MPMKFYGVTVPISIVFATVYFYYITREKPGKAKKIKMKGGELDVVVHKKPSDCKLTSEVGDLLHLHYTGYLKSNGKQFDSTREKGEPYVFKLGTCNDQDKPECIEGFRKGVTGMCAGEKRKVTVPPSLAFGKKGKPPDIPPNDSLIYHIEMVDLDSFK